MWNTKTDVFGLFPESKFSGPDLLTKRTEYSIPTLFGESKNQSYGQFSNPFSGFRPKSIKKQVQVIPFNIHDTVLKNKVKGIMSTGALCVKASEVINKKQSTLFKRQLEFAKSLGKEKAFVFDHTVRLSQIAPLVTLNVNDNDLKDIICKIFDDKDTQDVATVYLRFLKDLIIEKITTVSDAIDFLLTNAKKTGNRRLLMTLHFICTHVQAKTEVLPLDLFSADTEKDPIEYVSVAIFHFLSHDNNPNVAIERAVMAPYYPETVAKLVGDMSGASYGFEWIGPWVATNSWLDINNVEEIFETSNKLSDITM